MALQMTERDIIQPGANPEAGIGLSVTIRTAPLSSSSGSFSLDVHFTSSSGVTVLFGASGAGKTTILDCIAGLRQPKTGRIAVNGRVLFDSESSTNIPVPSRHVGYVFQRLALFPHMTARQNIEYGIADTSAAERQSLIAVIAESFGIGHLLDRRPNQISGGERQRVALARTLVTDPIVLLLDEPLSGLDIPTKSRIMDDLRTWNDNHRIPILYVTHDRSEVFALAERVVALEQGRVLSEGGPFEVLESPRQELMAYLAGFENIFDARVKALHEDRGTMTCGVLQHSQAESRGREVLDLEVPLARVESNSRVRVGVRAGDILLANVQPTGISARNIIPGRVLSITRHDMTSVVQVDCGAVFEVHITPQAQESLQLRPDIEVWLVLKTHSCHLLRG